MAALRRPLLLTVGWLCFALGMIGIAVPLMPTTIFWIIAVWCWSHSAPDLTHRILGHSRFGPDIARFLEDGSVSRQGKLTAVSGIAVGYTLWLLLTTPDVGVGALVSALLLSVAVWMLLRPEPQYLPAEPMLGMEAWVVVPPHNTKIPLPPQ